MVTEVPAARPAGYRTVLAHREFLAIAGAHTVSLLGTTVANVALAVLIFQRTASPLLSSLTFTLSFTPYLLGGLLAARLDRVPPRRLMVTCDLLQATCYLAMTVRGLPVPALLALLAAGSVAAPVFSGARAGLLPVLLGDGEGFVLGRSLLRVISQTSQVLGLALGGALLLVVAPRAALLLVAATCAASAVAIRAGVRAHPAVPAPAREDGHGGLHEVFADRERTRLLLLGWAVPLAAVAAEALAVPYVVALGLPPGSAGLLLWAGPVGAIAGELLTLRLLGPAARARAVLPLAVLVLVVPFGFAVQPTLPLAALLLGVSSAGFGCALGIDAQLLTHTPAALHRRTLAVASAGLMFWQGLGFALAGAGAELAPPRVVIPASSAVGLLAVALLRPRRASRLRDGPPGPAGSAPPRRSARSAGSSSARPGSGPRSAG
ncbi:MAG: major facilitator superfamily 1 [Mycobacterium sp.]|nr:major facilitator superfamily 1 [Mycobacterium sp.]